MRDPIRTLRKELSVTCPTDVYPLLKSIGKCGPVGAVTIVFVDKKGRFFDMLTVADGDDHVVDIVTRLLPCLDRRIAAIVLASDRTGEAPADRPSDEERWCFIATAARFHSVTMLDWFVVWGDKAFSVAEFATVPAGW